jgi:hypothetical protein
MANVAVAIAHVAAQPNTFHRTGSTIPAINLEFEATTMTATMIGTDITALITAAQYSVRMGFNPATLMLVPTTMANARIA